ncbi:SGNH/GDSL hydrolase family protein [Methylotuvimicrobium sp. KM2]|uniref:SGNH/GDSL hydrolase family protein n=1 Tax=Methylotuvimicrobium sp. KM2 TaxID=3133976 RepID=UPI003101A914
MLKTKPKTYKILIVLWLLLFSTANWAASGKRITVAVLGDSATQGVWANSTLGSPGLDFYLSVSKAINRLERLRPAQLVLIQQPESNLMAYSRLMERKFKFTANTQLSATAGNQSYSFATRLKQHTNRSVRILNVGFLAGSYKFSRHQLRRLKNKLAGRKPDYILVNFNIIDAVSGDTPDRFKINVKGFFNTLIRRYPRSQIIVTPLQDLSPMSALADIVSIPAFMGLPATTCRDIQLRAYGFFKSLYSDPAEMLRLQQNVADMNQLLSDEITKIRNRQLFYSAFQGKIALTENLPQMNQDWKEYLAADCVHPNLKGQAIIGDMLWDAFVRELSD